MCLCWDIFVFREVGGEAGMLEGAVEATGGGGNFSGMEEARKHFADVGVVESGATGDVSGMEWGRAFLEGFENGPALVGEGGLAQQSLDGVVIFLKPVD